MGLRLSRFAVRPAVGVMLRYGLALASVATALGLSLILVHHRLPRPFGFFSFVAIAISFWFAGTGPGLLAVLLSCSAMGFFLFLVPITEVRGPGWQFFLAIYAMFGVLVGWFSASRRRAERLLTEARDTLALRVEERTGELRRANVELQSAQAEVRHEKDRLKLLLDVTNQVVSNLQLRDLLRAISASVRRVMQCDCISLALPDPDGAHLRLSILDFPASKGFAREEAVIPIDGSPAGQVFRSGKPLVLSGDELNQVSAEVDPAMAEGYQSRCFLPVVSRGAVLGTLTLGRLSQQTVFTRDEVEFLTQVASQIAIAVENASAYRQIADLKDKLAQEKLYLEDEIRTDANFEEIIGKSTALRRVLKHVETVAPTESTVLIYGETGTGKELIARAIHNLSPRRAKTFVKLNCAAIPTGLLESELFGHEKGAFTGAVAQRIGRMELANQGTLFLDEVGEIPLELQPKLLRVLQEREFERLGSARTLRTDVRLIAATNRDLA